MENQRVQEEVKLKQIADNEAKKIAEKDANALSGPALPANSCSSVNSQPVAQSESALVTKLKGELAYQHLLMRLQAQRHELEMNQLQNESSRLFFLHSYS